MAFRPRSASFSDTFTAQKEDDFRILRNAENEKNILEAERDDLRSQLDGSQGNSEEIQKLSERIRELENFLIYKQAELQGLHMHAQAKLGDMANFYEHQISRGKAGSYKRALARDAKRDEQVQAAQSERDEALAQRDKLQDDNSILKQEISDLHNTRIQLTIKLEKKEQELSGRKEYWEKISNESKDISQKYNNQKKVIANLKNEIADLSDEAIKLREDKATIQLKMDKLGKTYNEVKNKFDSQEEGIKRVQEAHQRDLDDKDNLINILTRDFYNAKMKGHGEGSVNIALMQQISDLKEQVNVHKIRYGKLEKEKNNLVHNTIKLGQEEAKNTKIQGNLQLIHGQYNAVKEKNNALEVENQSLNERLAILIAENGELKAQTSLQAKTPHSEATS